MDRPVATPRSRLSRLRLRLGRLPLPVLLSAAFVICLVVVAIFADFIAPHSPYDSSLARRMLPPFWEQEGSLAYPLGTDLVGRDILSRLIFGARASLTVAAAAILLAAALGLAVGAIAGFVGGTVDTVLMRIADGVLAFPLIFLALLLVVIIGPNFWNVIIAITLMLWARYARVVRSETLVLRERDFVALARVAGCSSARILLHHIVPNVVNTLVVLMTLQVGLAIMTEAALSFLGAGVPPPTPAWGSMVAEGRNYINTAWWIVIAPASAITLTVLALNALGDGLRDLLDPRQRRI